ncbi:MAG: glycosyltransferase family 4 protein [Gammaproteobacteria bacterium]
MNGIALLAVAAIAAVVVATVLAPLRRRLLRAAMLDRPSARSMHQVPTPRGGGLAIALAVLAAHAVFAPRALAGGMPVAVFASWSLAAAGCALVGWLDDRRARPVGWRLCAQLIFAGLLVAPLLAHDAMVAGMVGAVIAVLACVWSVNLYNFMDGADGLAGLQLALTAAGALLLPGVTGDGAVAGVSAALAGAACGFLVWNRPPARLFMGDAGSYFIGFELAALALLAPLEGGSMLPWGVLFMPFVIDASLTLARRMLAGERFWQPHRGHVYQRLLLAGWPPWRLLGALVVVNVGICWPLAWWAAGSGGGLAAVLAALALAALWAWARVASAAAP